MARLRTLRAQAAAELRDTIERDYQPGDMLPSELALAGQVGLSRNTVREAIGQLVAEGLVERKWGVGTIVVEPAPPASFSITDVVPVREMIRVSGHEPRLERFECRLTVPDKKTTKILGTTDEVWYIERVISVDGEPAVYLRDWCLQTVAGKSVDLTSLADIEVDLVGLVRAQTGRQLKRVEGRILATMSSVDLTIGRSKIPTVSLMELCFTSEEEAIVYSVIEYNTSIIDLTIRQNFVM
jgi:GntR family transcriptional regulator